MNNTKCCGGGCPSGMIVRAVGSAMRPGRVLLGVFCLAVLVGGGHIWDAIVGSWITAEQLPAQVQRSGAVAPFELTLLLVESSLASIKSGVLTLSWASIVEGGLGLTVGTPMTLWGVGAIWYIVCFGLYSVVVLSISIGLQSRFEAITVAEGEPPSMNRLTHEAGWLSGAWVWSWLTPLCIIAVLALGIMAAGFVLLNIPVLNMVGGILWGVVMLLALGLSIALLGLGVSGALLIPAVAVDGCAGPDAMHRAFTGATSRPLRWLWYVVVIIISLGLGLLVVETVAQTTARVSTGLGGAWVFNDVMLEAQGDLGEASDAGWTTRTTGEFIGFWLGLLTWLVAGWTLCFLSAATTRAWMALRSTIEGLSPEHIWRPGLMPGTLAPVPDGAASDETAGDDASAGEGTEPEG
ncbi:MAG: hypothetical protein MK101_10715 [Phycisphaerales bacterium]|nr:hypothetical protein [Phycisphaerales bacterium]